MFCSQMWKTTIGNSLRLYCILQGITGPSVLIPLFKISGFYPWSRPVIYLLSDQCKIISLTSVTWYLNVKCNALSWWGAVQQTDKCFPIKNKDTPSSSTLEGVGIQARWQHKFWGSPSRRGWWTQISWTSAAPNIGLWLYPYTDKIFI